MGAGGHRGRGGGEAGLARLSDPETRERRALEAGMAEVGVGEATLVTLYDEETLMRGDGRVRVVPAWRWLLKSDREEEERCDGYST